MSCVKWTTRVFLELSWEEFVFMCYIKAGYSGKLLEKPQTNLIHKSQPLKVLVLYVSIALLGFPALGDSGL